MAEKKVLRYYHHIITSFTAGSPSTITSVINVPFTPDEVVVRQLSYQRTTVPSNGGYYLTCDELTGQHGADLGLMKDRCANLSNATYSIGRQVSGTYTFQSKKVDGTLSGLTSGRFSLNLEFRQYV